MPKHIGNRVGAAVTSGFSQGGIFNMFDQYFFARQRIWTATIITLASRITTSGATPFSSPTHAYWVWTGPGSITVPAAGNSTENIDYVVVGGGGGGGRANFSGSYQNGAGGGAGGFRTGTAAVSPGVYAITIGAGGVPGASGPTTPLKPAGRNGENGVPTVWATVITSEGGGGGGGGAPGLGFSNGRSGGSGGGGGEYIFNILTT